MKIPIILKNSKQRKAKYSFKENEQYVLCKIIIDAN